MEHLLSSYHRGPDKTKIPSFSKATSRVFARFYDSDSTLSNMDAFKSYIVCNGMPMSLYTDNVKPLQGP
jgi:hypothetical protein